MIPTLRRTTESDLPTILGLLDRYYTEGDVWLRDTPETTLDCIKHPTLGYFLTEIDGIPVACVLLRPLPTIPHATECKRLYVAPEHRGHRLADRLMQAAEDHARSVGLHWIYLDTKDEFTAAIALYRRRGYEDTPRYNDNAQATIFLRKSLTV